jgi:hypothetical protein
MKKKLSWTFVIALAAISPALAIQIDRGEVLLPDGSSVTNSAAIELRGDDRATYHRLKIDPAYEGEPLDFEGGCNVRGATYKDRERRIEFGVGPISRSLSSCVDLTGGYVRNAGGERSSSDLVSQNEGLRSPETLMSDDKKPKLIDRSGRLDEAQLPRSDTPLQRPGPETPLHPRRPMRTQEELTPIAHKLLDDAGLMQRFREMIGSEDRERARAVFDEVTHVAESIDPTITYSEGTRLVVVLMKLIGIGQTGGAND